METVPVWEITGESTMSANLYAFWITFWTAIGIATSAVAACLTLSWEYSLFLVVPAFIASIAGVFIAQKHDDPLISLGGYMLITVSFGAITGPVVALYTPASVVRILFLTTAVVIGLGVVGAILPKSLESWWSWLFGGLLLLLAGQILLPLAAYLGVPVGNAMTVWDWAGVALFSGLIVFDLNRAMRIPYTMDNAIDAAVAVYLDFINLFLRLLSLLGEADRD
jgi:FtsH-binding integral membrane protein